MNCTDKISSLACKAGINQVFFLKIEIFAKFVKYAYC